MSFLLLAFRKLSLKRQINNDNARLMRISMERNSIQNKLAAMQKQTAAMQNAFGTLTSSLSNLSNSVFSAQVQGFNGQAQNASRQYQELLRKHNYDTNNGEVLAAKAAMESAQSSATAQAQALWAQQSMAAMGQSALQQFGNSIFETTDKAQMEALTRMDNELELEQENLESRLQLESAEYDSLEKQVAEAAKNAAPQYVA